MTTSLHRVRSPRPLRAAVAALLTMATVVALNSSASATLSPNTFNGGDGDLVVNNSDVHDWANVPNRALGPDKSADKTDNAFGQGTKEDDPNVTIVTGSIPPNKNDLTRFYEASQLGSNNHVYLDLAWERLVNIGNANLDFEINRSVTTGFTSSKTGAITLTRTAGDLLVTYDFSGSGTPTLGINTWLTAASQGSCFSSNAYPCWGKHVTLNGANSEGKVNTGTIAEPIAGGNLTAGLFGEASIDLTAAGVFPAGTCQAFGSVFVKSRSSSSFTAEIKDFIAPQQVNINNCSSLTIKKVTQNDPGTAQTFSFTPGTKPGGSNFTLANNDTKVYSGLGADSYTVSEGAEPAGWDFVGVSCTDTAGSDATTWSHVTGASVTVDLTLGQDVTCTFTNHYTNSPTITTTLHPASAGVGSSVYDSASLSGATATAGGTVTYTVWTNATCTSAFALGGTFVGNSLGTVNVSNGTVPDSASYTYTAAGSYYYKVVYSGDGNNAGDDDCNELLTITKANPTASTAQDLIPNDGFSLSGAYHPDTTTSVTFNLYDPDHATCTGTPAYTETVSIASDGTASTSNSTFHATTVGTWRWAVSWPGDSNNNAASSACGTEHFTITN